MKDITIDPTGQKSNLEITKIKKALAPILLLLIAFLITMIVYNIFSSPEEKVDKHKEQAINDTRQINLTGDEPKNSGLAANKVPVTPNEQPPVPANIKEPVNPVMQARLQELEQIRRFKMQLNMQALQAPLETSITNTSRNNNQATQMPDFSKLTELAASKQEIAASQQYDNSEQRDKEDFLNSRSATDEWTLNKKRNSGKKYELKTGTVIPGIMLTGINSDLPGKIIGQVSQNVYDTASGQELLIPQGSRLFGVYDSRVAVAQNRVLIAWNRVIFPDGSAIDLETMPGTDQAGHSGFADEVDNHYFKVFGSAIMMSLITGGMAYGVDSLSNSNSNSDSDKPSFQDEMGTALASQLGQASLQLLQQNINIKPTLEIRSGYRFNLVLVKDVAFEKPYKPYR